MKYSETVRDLAAKNAHWRYYDENFRFLRQKTLFPWDQIHWELWLQALHMQKAAPVASSDARNKNLKSPFPSGYCWKFHRGENVPAAISATNVLNVDLSIPPTNVPFQSEYHIQHQQPCHEQPHQQLSLANQPRSPALSRPMSTQIKVDKLQAYLHGYPFRTRQYLIDGFRFGFSIDYVGPRINFSSKNLVSAIANPSAVDEKLANEIKLGRIVGPFERQPFPVFHISPLGLIPKKVPGEFRLIHHLSFPEGRSINSHIPKIASSVHYANIDDAIRLVRRTGRGCALAKTDIKTHFVLFRSVPRITTCWVFVGGITFMLTGILPWGSRVLVKFSSFLAPL